MYGYSYAPPAWLVGLALMFVALPASAVFGLTAAWVFAVVTRDSSGNAEN